MTASKSRTAVLSPKVKVEAASSVPTEAPLKLPSDWDLTLRAISLREAGQPLFFALAVVLLTVPDLFDLASAASPIPAAARHALSAFPATDGLFGTARSISLTGRYLWETELIGKYGLLWAMTLGVFIWTTLLYWTHAGILSTLDIALRYPKSRLGQWAKQRKIQDTRLVVVEQWIKCAKVVVRNQLLINVPLGFAYFRYLYNWSVERQLGLAAATDTTIALESPAAIAWAAALPSPWIVLRDVLACGAIEEALFYSSHRLFHYGWLYQSFHKIHHQFVAPIGLAATYAHPLEHILSNLSPVLLGPALFGMHPFSVYVWLSFAITTTIHTHSGYELYGWPSARKHDYHHYAFIYQFGVTGFVDTLFGTDGGDRFRRYVAKYDARIKGVKAGTMTPAEADASDDADLKRK
ncbi:hypothetical protein BC828DRAFT_405383 [Blastocladiella britannica]|nr:hypothetical protein BC828DRAFT_405383 [Blastocladiella britannica]